MGGRSSIGGSAAAGGTNYQSRSAAWLATRVLLEQNASPFWNLPSDCTLEFVRCESGAHTDDLLAGTLDSGFIYFQAKRQLSLSESEDSDFASTLDQFTRQYLVAGQGQGGTDNPWNRPFTPACDRLVLLTSSESSAPVRVDFETVCRRAETLAAGQALSQTAQTESETSALTKARAHIARTWTAVRGVAPSDDEVAKLLSSIFVHTLDIESGGAHEGTARDSLRQILKVPTQTEAAWRSLISTFTDLSALRSGMNRGQIQQLLLNSGVDINPARSFQEDIRKLRSYSTRVLTSLDKHSKIFVRGNQLTIERSILNEVNQVAEVGNLLVIGDPGSGKSGLVHNLAASLIENGRDVILLSAERLGACSTAEIRDEIGLSRNLLDVLEGWPGRSPGFLVIDALDVARAETAAAALREIIASVTQLNGRWKVIASVRKFDLRYSLELQRLFPIHSSPTSVDQAFRNVQHINVPVLNDQELSQISAQIPQLGEVTRNANPKLQQLLRVPFNLRLMGDLLDTGVASNSLTPIQTQLDLLDRYWTARIIRTDGQRDARELLLRSVCLKMLEATTLRTNRESVASEVNSRTIHDLLQSNVLSEWQADQSSPIDQNSITFSHHILFDYAFARLVLRGSSPPLKDRLVTTPELAIFGRPSIILHFQFLWSLEPTRRQFWQVSIELCGEPRVSEIAKVICGVVAIESASTIDDIEGLLDSLDSANATTKLAGEKLLRHVFGALHSSYSSANDLLLARGDVWCHAIGKSSESLRPETAYTVRALLCYLLTASSQLTSTQRGILGQASRRLLEFAWQPQSPDLNLANQGIHCVCKTYLGDASASRELLRRVIVPERLRQYGFEELPALTSEIEEIIAADPGFATEVYEASFSFSEESDEQMSMGNSRILPLLTNRRQNYEMAYYRLQQSYKDLIEADFVLASKAAGVSLRGYISQKHSNALDGAEVSFALWGINFRVRTDHSYIWDRGGVYSQDPAIQILDEWESRFEELIQSSDNQALVRSAIESILQAVPFAVIMGRLMTLGVRFPEQIGRTLASVLESVQLLTSVDLRDDAVELLAVMHPLLPIENRQNIERAICSIPSSVDENRRSFAERIRERFTSVLRLDCVQTEEIKPYVRAELTQPSPRHNGITSGWSEITEEDEMAELGVPVREPANVQVRQLEIPIKTFNDKFLNEAPTENDIQDIHPHLVSLNSFLIEQAGIHPEQHEYAETNLIRACSNIAKASALDCTNPTGALVREILLRGATHLQPVPSQDSEDKFHEMTGWSLYPRSEAASGLILLSRFNQCCNSAVLGEVERLLFDPHPLVRHQIAFHLRLLGATNSDKLWELVDRVSQAEMNRGVLAAFISGSLFGLTGNHRARVVPLMSAIHRRSISGPGSERIRRKCVRFFVELYIWKNEPLSDTFVQEVISNLDARTEDAKIIVPLLRGPIAVGPISPSDPEQDLVRRRAVNLAQNLVDASSRSFHRIQNARAGVRFAEWPEEDRELIKNFASIINDVGNQIYFASRAYQETKSPETEPDKILTSQEKQRFYSELGTVMDSLAGVGFASVAHHLLETLEAFIEIDPKGVFLRMAKVIEGGKSDAYQFESLAVDLMVRLVERYLAEYRSLLQDVDCRQALISILDIFVEAGWPKARALTYQLDDIFR